MIVHLNFYAVTRLVMASSQGMVALKLAYSRVFETTNQALLENFADS